MPHLTPVDTSNELEVFDPLIPHSQSAIVAPEDPFSNTQQVEQEVMNLLLYVKVTCVR